MLRRALAVLLLLGALHLATSAVRQPTSGTPVVVAAADVAAGETIGSSDVTVRETVGPPPEGAATEADELVGRRASIAIGRDEVLTPARAVGPGSLADLPSGHRALTLPLLGPSPAVRPGDRVDVHEGGRDAPVVEGALVLAADQPTDPAVAAATDTPEVVVSVPSGSADRLVAALGSEAGGSSRAFVLAVRP